MEHDEKQEQNEPEQIEQVEYDGEQYAIAKRADGKIEIEIPPDLDEAGQDKFVAAIAEKSKTVGSYYKKLKELNLEKQDPAWIAFKEAYDKGEIKDEEPKSEEPAADQLKEKEIWEELGLESADMLDDWIVDHPVEWARKLEERQRQAASATIAEEMNRRDAEARRIAEEMALEHRIKDLGLEPKEIRAYARFNNMPYGERALELYRMEHAPKKDPVIEERIKAQREQITFIDRGTRSAVTRNNLDEHDLRGLTREQIEARKKYYMDLASRG